MKKRENYFKTLLGSIMLIMGLPVAALELLPKTESAKQQRLATAQLTNETIPVYALASAIHKHGLPKSLIFISQPGMAIDLLKIEALSQEKAFDELLDNMKVS